MKSGYIISDYVKMTAGTDSSFESISFLHVEDNLAQLKDKIEKMFGDSRYGNILRIKGFVIEDGVSYQVNATRYD